MIRIFSHYVPIKGVFLVFLELLLFAVAVYAAADYPTSHATGETVLAGGASVGRSMFLAFFLSIVLTAVGMYDEDVVESARATLIRGIAGLLLGYAVLTMVGSLSSDLRLQAGVLPWVLGLGMGASLIIRLVVFSWLSPRAFQKRVLVLGTGSRAASVAELIKGRRPPHHVRIVGFLPIQAGQHHVDTASILPVGDSLLAAVRKHRVDEIVIALRDRRGGALPIQELLDCRLQGITVMDLATFFERERCQLHLESINVSWMVFGEGFRQGLLRASVKRAVDLAASTVLLAVTFPVMLITSLLILLEGGGPIFYRQERVGQGGRVFTIFKFRSMRNDAERDGKPRWAGTNDDRTTSIGRVIRKLRIDELPQIFNVLRGDMSFVGPRPERPFFVEQLTSKIPYYSARHSIKPGITGWAQVRYPYGASLDDAVEKLQYDLYYVKNHTLFLDLMILASTVQVVLWGKGAR